MSVDTDAHAISAMFGSSLALKASARTPASATPATPTRS
jgi:hypothetical protein